MTSARPNSQSLIGADLRQFLRGSLNRAWADVTGNPLLGLHNREQPTSMLLVKRILRISQLFRP